MEYSSDSNLSLFISVFPISKPEYVVLAIIEDPKKIKEENYSNTGATVAAPLVKKIILDIIKIYGIPVFSKNDMLKASNEKYGIINQNVSF